MAGGQEIAAAPARVKVALDADGYRSKAVRDMPFSIVRNDITKVSADVIVNAANERLAPGGGVCGAIFSAAGFDEMSAACGRIGHCPTGSAVSTPGFGLPCRWVVHTVGPIWRGGGYGEESLLRSCYRSVFAEVERLGAASVALPLVSAGIFGYPARAALDVARQEAQAFLARRPDATVMLVIFSADVVAACVRDGAALRSFIDDAYVAQSPFVGARDRAADLEASLPLPAPSFAPPMASMAAPQAAPSSPRTKGKKPKGRGLFRRGAQEAAGTDELAERLANLDASFSQTLLSLIDARGLTDAEVYHRANLSRQLFSKIRSNADYRPTKPTAVALAMALGLTLPETRDLLGRAGIALSRSSQFDVIVEFYISRGVYDVLLVNEALFAYDQPLLGSGV